MVPLVDSVAIVFSEPMDRSSVESSFFLSPSVEYRERSWDRQTWILRLREPIREDQTYVGLVGTGIRDRQRISPKEPWSFAFTTGESLDTGAVSGKVVGQRYPPRGALIHVWPWESGLPDTLAEGFPEDPLRLGQADAQGEFRVGHLPRGRPLQICALYDRDQDRRFNPRRDRWGCLDEPVILSDTLGILRGVDLYVTSPDEPGTVAGSVVDSSCVLAAVTARMARIQAERDSLGEWMGGVRSAEQSEEPAVPGGAGDAAVPHQKVPDAASPDGALEGRSGNGAPAPAAGWVRGLTAEDSLRIEREYLRLDGEEQAARSDSLWCAHPVVVRLVDADSTVVRESYGTAGFRWNDVPPGIYRLMGFRDMNENRRPDPGEPDVWFPHPLEVRPLRVMEGFELVLPSILDAVRAGVTPRDRNGSDEEVDHR